MKTGEFNNLNENLFLRAVEPFLNMIIEIFVVFLNKNNAELFNILVKEELLSLREISFSCN